MPNKEFPIKNMDPCIFRNCAGIWLPGFFSGYECWLHEGRPFVSMEGLDYDSVAPLAGNEKLIREEGDAFGLWDLDRMQQEGFIEKD